MPSLYLVPKHQTSASPGTIPDALARASALDTTQSFIVEAPAGSGKTALLIQRFLKLLTDPAVEDPAQVLAITFTRKATAELLDRVLSQLASAAAATEPDNDFDRATRALAESVLARDAELGWALLDKPSRLNIRTIDSVSGEIASALPVLSGSAGAYSPSEDTAPLYAEAARRTLQLLGSQEQELNDALTTLLLHRDGNLADCELLIASMLGTREQWGELVPLSGPQLDADYLDEEVLPKLDRALDLAICRTLTLVAKSIPQPLLHRLSEFASEMGHAEGYNGNPSPIALCAGRSMPPEEKSAHLDNWRAIIDLLLTKSGDFRASKGINKRNVKFEIQKHHTAELVAIIDSLRHDEPLRDLLCSVRSLPSAIYPRDTWTITKALFHVLSRALAELQLVFAERGVCDFTEVHLLARIALRHDSSLEGFCAAFGTRLQHLLVDEMQDTSTSQYEFIQLLTHRWDGHSQTVFLVGDPKQSIYLFRQARVERFVRTLASAALGDLPLTPLRLTANFRSQPALVDAFNDDFALIFPSHLDPSEPEQVPFQPASAIRTGKGERIWHAAVSSGDRFAIRSQAALHANQMRDIVATWRAKPLPPGRTEPWRIAILVRSRTHVAPIAAALREPTTIPFRAVEIESLAERPEILDLLALTRALLHPADRIAWLALLRSPVCGLSLADLHRLAGDSIELSEQTIFALISSRGDELSEDGISRLEPFWRVIANALHQRGSLTISQSVQRTWRAFNAPSFASSDALANAETFFRLLDQLETPSGTLSLNHLQQNVAKLYAASSTDPDAVDLMTIHKAKGLEWDVVLVPELHRRGRNNSQDLLAFLETNPEDITNEDIAAGIFAPIAARGQDATNLTVWMRSIASAREAAERKRLFYVACTRAREEVHLFAAPQRKNDGGIRVESDSLLHAAWPAAEFHFESVLATVIPMPQPLALAASATTPAPRLIQRIPSDLASAAALQPLPQPVAGSISIPPFLRPEGSFSARVFGNAMHAFLEQLATLMATGVAPSALLAELPTWSGRIAAVLRAGSLGQGDATRLTADIIRGLTRAFNDREGRWLLAAHPRAASEFSLTSLDEETIRMDRTFLAGAEPLQAGATHLWIVDYKTTSHGSANLAAFLEEERAKYEPQLEAYARRFPGPTPIRLALFYPMLPRLIWWNGPEPNAD